MGAPTSTLLNKLQHAGGQVVVLSAPPEFEPILFKWRADGLPVSQRRTPGSQFVLAFVRTCSEIEHVAGSVVSSVGTDGVLWFAYPQQSSVRYRSDINQNQSWALLGRMGFEGMRQVVLDDDWTALRFRRVEERKSAARRPARAAPDAVAVRVGGTR